MTQQEYCKQYKIRTVGAVFQNELDKKEPRFYTYLVPPALPAPQIDTFAVVLVRGRYEVVKITTIGTALDPKAKFAYKFLVDYVDSTNYDHALVEQSSLVDF